MVKDMLVRRDFREHKRPPPAWVLTQGTPEKFKLYEPIHLHLG